MRNDFLPFSKPSISEEDIAAVADVLRSGWITTGPKVAQFEEDFKKYTSCGEAVSMTSETSVMHALLRALNIVVPVIFVSISLMIKSLVCLGLPGRGKLRFAQQSPAVHHGYSSDSEPPLSSSSSSFSFNSD